MTDEKKAKLEEIKQEVKILTRPYSPRRKFTLPKKTDYTNPKPEELQAFRNICSMIAEGHSLSMSCETLMEMSISKFNDILAQNGDDLKEVYARACEEREQRMFDFIEVEAKNDANDWYINDRGTKVPNPVAVQRSRLVIDTAMKMLAVMNNKKYGTKHTLQGDNDNPIKIEQITGMVIE